MFRVVVAVSLFLLLAAGARADDDEAPSSSTGINRLTDALQGGSSFRVRATAAVALGRIGDPRVIPILATAIKEDDSYAVRAAAAGALGRISDAAAVAPLLDALHDGDEYVRNEANGALDRFHSAAFLYSFRDALRSDDAVVRLAAVRAYGDVMREPDASAGIAAFVVNALGDEDEAVVAVAEVAVSAIAHERAVPLLVDGLVNGASSIRGACARLMEKRADPRAIEPLIALITDTSQPEDVRRPARTALKRHVDYLDVATYAKSAADPASPDRQKSLRVLAVLGDPRAVGLIEASLKDADAGVRINGARAAVELGGVKARQFVEAASARESEPRQKQQLELILKSFR